MARGPEVKQNHTTVLIVGTNKDIIRLVRAIGSLYDIESHTIFTSNRQQRKKALTEIKTNGYRGVICSDDYHWEWLCRKTIQIGKSFTVYSTDWTLQEQVQKRGGQFIRQGTGDGINELGKHLEDLKTNS